MYKNSARFRKRNTYAFKPKEITVNIISVHNSTWKRMEKRINYSSVFGRKSSYQGHLHHKQKKVTKQVGYQNGKFQKHLNCNTRRFWFMCKLCGQ